MRKAVIYLRVSSKKQEQEGFSIKWNKKKRQDTEQLAKDLGWELTYGNSKLLDGKYNLTPSDLSKSFLAYPGCYFVGSHNGIPFKLLPLYLGGSNDPGSPIFYRLLLEIENISPKASDIVLATYNALAYYEQIFKSAITNYTKVEIEDQDLNHKFAMYAKFGADIPYVLPPNLTEKLMAYDQFNFESLVVELGTTSLIVCGNFKPYTNYLNGGYKDSTKKEIFLEFVDASFTLINAFQKRGSL